MPIDIVAVRTKRHSCNVDWKHSGRAPSLWASMPPFSSGGDPRSPVVFEGAAMVVDDESICAIVVG